MTLRHLALIAAALSAGAAHAAGNCESIRDGIDAKIRAAGVARFSLSIVDVGSTAPGRNVGSCERGSKKILYLAGDAAPPAPAASAAAPSRRAPEGVITECRDGTVAKDGNCPKK